MSYYVEEQIVQIDLFLQSQYSKESTQDCEDMELSDRLKFLVEVCQIMHTSQSFNLAQEDIKKKVRSFTGQILDWKTFLKSELETLLERFKFSEKVMERSFNKEGVMSQQEFRDTTLLTLHLFNSFLTKNSMEEFSIKAAYNFWALPSFYSQKNFDQSSFSSLLKKYFGYCLSFITKQNIQILLKTPLPHQISKKTIASFLENQKIESTNVLAKKYFPLLLVDLELLPIKLAQSAKDLQLGVCTQALLMIKCPKFYYDLLQKAKKLVKRLFVNPANGIVQTYFDFFQSYRDYRIYSKKLKLDETELNFQTIKNYLNLGVDSITGVLSHGQRFYGLTLDQKIVVNFSQLLKKYRELKFDQMANKYKELESLTIVSLTITILHQLSHYVIRKIGLVKPGSQTFDRGQLKKQNKQYILNEEISQFQDGINKEKNTEDMKSQDSNETNKQKMTNNKRFIQKDQIQYKMMKFVVRNQDNFLQISKILEQQYKHSIYQQAQISVFQWEIKRVLNMITLKLLDQIMENKYQTKDQVDEQALVLFRRLASQFFQYKSAKELSEKFYKINDSSLSALYRHIQRTSYGLDLDKLIMFFELNFEQQNKEVSFAQYKLLDALSQLKNISLDQISQNIFEQYSLNCLIIDNVYEKAYQFFRVEHKGLILLENYGPNTFVKMIIRSIIRQHVLSKYFRQFVKECVELDKTTMKNLKQYDSGWIMETRLFETLGQNYKIYPGDQELLEELTTNKDENECQDLRWRIGNSYLNKQVGYGTSGLCIGRIGASQTNYITVNNFCFTTQLERN